MNSDALFDFLCSYAYTVKSTCEYCGLPDMTVFRLVGLKSTLQFVCFKCLNDIFKKFEPSKKIFICMGCGSLTFYPKHRPQDTVLSNQQEYCVMCADKMDSDEFLFEIARKHKRKTKQTFKLAEEELLNIFNNEGGAGNRVAVSPTKKKGGVSDGSKNNQRRKRKIVK